MGALLPDMLRRPHGEPAPEGPDNRHQRHRRARRPAPSCARLAMQRPGCFDDVRRCRGSGRVRACVQTRMCACICVHSRSHFGSAGGSRSGGPGGYRFPDGPQTHGCAAAQRARDRVDALSRGKAAELHREAQELQQAAVEAELAALQACSLCAESIDWARRARSGRQWQRCRLAEAAGARLAEAGRRPRGARVNPRRVARRCGGDAARWRCPRGRD